MPKDRQTIQMPTRNPIVEALFSALDKIPVETQQKLMQVSPSVVSGMSSGPIGGLQQMLTQPQQVGETYKGLIGAGGDIATQLAQSAFMKPYQEFKGQSSQVPQSTQIQPVTTQATTPQTTSQVEQESTTKQGFQIPQGLKDFAKAMAVPGIAALAGSTIPGALPGAAGFSTGYMTELERQKQRKHELTKERLAKTKVPSWKQEQLIKSIKAGLKSGKVTLGKEFGKPSVYEPKSLDEALSVISEAGLDPTLFEEELRSYIKATDLKDELIEKYTKGDVVNPFKKEYPDAYQKDGEWRVMKDGQEYRIEK